jgi:hypothetical protein
MLGLALNGMPSLHSRNNSPLVKRSEDDGLIGKQERIAYVKEDRFYWQGHDQ